MASFEHDVLLIARISQELGRAAYRGEALPDRSGTVNAERSVLYFGGVGIGTETIRLLAWTVVVVALLLLSVSRKLERQRERLNSRAHRTRPGETLSVART
jgi:hypothetical protein